MSFYFWKVTRCYSNQDPQFKKKKKKDFSFFLFQLRILIHSSFSFCLNDFFLTSSGFSGCLASQHAAITLPLALKAEELSKNNWEKPEAVSSA